MSAQRHFTPVIGQTLGHYRIVAQIGVGGMGEVYSALDERLERDVALKILPAGALSDESARKRFRKEALALSKLNHPNIATIYDFDTDSGIDFIAMELVTGETLSEKVASGALPEKTVVTLGSQIADALAEAHEHGIVHRDLKPGNVMVTPKDRVKLLDFGLAKLLRPVASMTTADTLSETQGVSGTLPYMAPEQLRGELAESRSDIFSFGSVLYEMATRRRPFRETIPSRLTDAILHQPAVAPRALNPRTSPELERIILKCLEKDPDDRYQSAKEILVDLRRLGSQTAVAASPPARLNKFDRRTLAITAGAAAIVLASVALGIYFWKSHQRALNLVEMHIGRLTESGNAEDVAISPNGQYVVYVLRKGENRSLNVRQVATGSDVQILTPAAVELRGLTFSPDGNYIFFLRSTTENFSVDFLYQMPVLGGTPRELIRDVDSPISFSPDGKQFAFVRSGDLMVSNNDGSGERVLARRPVLALGGPGWSPDGKTIAFAGTDLPGESHLWAVSPVDGSMHVIYRSQSEIGRALWLPDGSGLLAMIGDPAQRQGQGQLWYISYPSGEANRFTNDLTDYALHVLDLTHDGKSLVTVENTISSDLWVVRGDDATSLRQITSGRTAVRAIAAGPEGTIVFVNQKGDLYSIHDDGSALALLTPNMHGNGKPSACPDGRHIVFESTGTGGRNIWRIDADGSHVTKLTQSGSAFSPLCSPDSQSVQYIDIDQMKNWRVPIGGGTPTLVDLKNLAAVAMSFSPDGKLIAYNAFGPTGDTPNQITVIPSTGGEPIYRFPLRPDPSFERLHWTPNGAGLDYHLTNKGVGNIWRQPVPKGTPRQVTNFASGQIFSFDWSRDGKQLYVARGSVSSDIVLITNFR
jgi:eukaryotic-like serine/threonine-protein kinase